MLDKTYKPTLPFEGFKWKWASVQCTEGINDPVVLLGVLYRMRKLEKMNAGIKYSSVEFAQEIEELSNDLSDSIRINLADRTGERNLIRNSGQYWKALYLIDADDRSGMIALTDFGRKVADRDISQAEFAATIIRTHVLPNRIIQSREECQLWEERGIKIYPLKLILEILQLLDKDVDDYITVDELIRIIIPLSGCNATPSDFANFITWYRNGEINIEDWPDCCPEANDKRIAREFLLFLKNYGYINLISGTTRQDERYEYNYDIDIEIREILSGQTRNESVQAALNAIRQTDAVSDVERIRVQRSQARPNQARFRRQVLAAYERCIITNVAMQEVLEAAHIKPYQYNGEDTIANGIPMRTDIHVLFDTGHLRISETGEVLLSTRARMDYGALIPPRIVIPATVNQDYLRWRWENFNGI